MLCYWGFDSNALGHLWLCAFPVLENLVYEFLQAEFLALISLGLLAIKYKNLRINISKPVGAYH